MIELRPHSAVWAAEAQAMISRVSEILGENAVDGHHFGSTSIPGIRAKPTLDVMVLVHDLALVDQAKGEMRQAGFESRGEQGIPGRRLFVLLDPESGARVSHVHCYEVDSPQVARHLIFRDYLRTHPDRARAYEAEKVRCQALFPVERGGYSAAKDAWIRAEEVRALEWADRRP